jgi:hypothetical protein
LKRLIIIFLVFLQISQLQAQKRARNFRQHEVGIFLGGSYYLGDLNPGRHFFLSQPAGGIFYRFTPNYRYAFRGGVNFGSVTGDDSQSEDPDQRKRNLNFKSRINEFNVLAEFNFLEYRISNDKHRFTFFLFAGIDVFNFRPMGNLGGGQWESLRELNTEGRSKKYKLWQVSIPFGCGIKLNVAKRMGIGLEWGPRKTFTDYIDDVSKTYPNPAVNPPNGALGLAFSNRSKDGGGEINSQRGNPRTKDWYVFFGLTLNIKLTLSPEPCYTTGFD